MPKSLQLRLNYDVIAKTLFYNRYKKCRPKKTLVSRPLDRNNSNTTVVTYVGMYISSHFFEFSSRFRYKSVKINKKRCRRLQKIFLKYIFKRHRVVSPAISQFTKFYFLGTEFTYFLYRIAITYSFLVHFFFFFFFTRRCRVTSVPTNTFTCLLRTRFFSHCLLKFGAFFFSLENGSI